MALELHVAGPGLEVSRRLEPGESALILGRDADCTICLPDPERNISRRHLSVWNEADQLHFHVLSVVNGVETAAGELPPGARGILPPGEALGLSAFRLTVAGIAAAPGPPPGPASDADTDPWTEFQKQAAQLATVAAGPDEPTAMDDDPFGDWGFSSTFAPGAPGGALRADGLLPAADLQPFFAGLGIDPAVQGPFTQGELQALGRLARIALQGLLQVSQVASATRQEALSEDATVAETRELNPLRMDTPLETKLHYLFGGQAAIGAFLPPDRAVMQVVGDLAAHQQAMSEAMRETIEGVIKEFEPDGLKKRLLGGGARIFESAKAWDAFAKDYAHRVGAGAGMVQKALDRHFAPAYARALMRAKRNTTGRPPP
jgi:predicted component of type VI protein secretion system